MSPQARLRAHVVFIESNTSGTGRLFVQAARRLGYDPLLVTQDPARYAYVAADDVPVLRQSCEDVEALARALDELAARAPIAGILSSSEYFIATAAEVARRRGLPAADPQAVRACRDKWRQRRCLEAAGVGGPAYVLARSPHEALAALAHTGLPAVLKPSEGTGSRGVRLCSDVEQVRAHAAALLSERTNERGQPIEPALLVEQYVTWPEYSAEFFGADALGVVRKHVSPEPYFVETGHDFPAPLASDEVPRLAQALRTGLRALGLVHGPTHVEFRWQAGRLALMEVNPRLAGGFIPELVRLATGVDLIEASVALAVGRPVDLRPSAQAHASIRFLCPERGGRLAGFGGLDEASRVPGVVDVRLYRQAGDEHAVHHDFRDRIGHVVARAGDGESAARAAEAGLSRIEVAWS